MSAERDSDGGPSDRPVRDQARDAAGELARVIGPAVGFGLLGGVAALAAGSLLFEEGWVTALLAVVVMMATVVPIVLERVHTLGSRRAA